MRKFEPTSHVTVKGEIQKGLGQKRRDREKPIILTKKRGVRSFQGSLKTGVTKKLGENKTGPATVRRIMRGDLEKEER